MGSHNNCARIKRKIFCIRLMGNVQGIGENLRNKRYRVLTVIVLTGLDTEVLTE